MEIRLMTPEDIPAAAKLERLCFREAWSEDALAGELQTAGGVFLSAWEEEKYLGHMGMYSVLDEGYVHNVAVEPSARRRGVATALIKAALSVCRDRDLSFLTLEARERNAAAIALYEKLGFVFTGRRKKFYAAPEEDALLMTYYIKEKTSP